MIDRKALLSDLQKQVKELEKDLRSQAETAVETTPASGTATPPRKVRDRLRAEYDLAFKLGRTAATWAAWRDERVTQAAVAWVLGTVFVRFCEDNGLLTSPYLAGPTHDRMVLAEEAQEEFFHRNPAETDRGWLLAAFAEIAASQAGALLFDRKHNPLYQIPVSHDAAKDLITFWRRRTETGHLVHDFVSDDWDTRFLGDLYQDLSEAARKTYALLQTPEFVEEFILDHTLTPAIAEFGHEELRMIDPTCGSGHFVLGAFHRLLDEWIRHSPTRDRRELVSRALKSVHGVDLNPFAIAIARFRLFIAALKASSFTTFSDAQNYEFTLNLAIGDSLIKARQLALPGMESESSINYGADHQGTLFGTSTEQTDLFNAYEDVERHVTIDELASFAYDTEDVHTYPGILNASSYHVVVGNPPYITVKDRRLNHLYRELYSACAGAYALSVPFAQRFFELAQRADNDARGAGYVGQITSNSFMKREFGKSLIGEFFAKQVELTHVIDSSGAYIPGHGTPTTILFGRNRKWNRQDTVRLVMSVRGEPSPPKVAALGKVWQAILLQTNQPGSESEWLSVADFPRTRLSSHPWSLSGGGAGDLLQILERAGVERIGTIATNIGFGAVTREDSAYMLGFRTLQRHRVSDQMQRPLVEGETIRDWGIANPIVSLWPYDHETLEARQDRASLVLLWPYRQILASRIAFGKSQVNRGLAWYEFSMFFRSRYGHPHVISTATVATHNHFSLDRYRRVFKDTALVVLLPQEAPEELSLELLSALNSSTVCFWMKQMCHDKGIRGEGGGITSDEWERFYQLNSANLTRIPLPKKYPAKLGRQLDQLAQKLDSQTPYSILAADGDIQDRLRAGSTAWHSTRAKMIAFQEELDWDIYHRYGLLDQQLTAPVDTIPELRLGERAFEIVLARRVAQGEVETQWFMRHGSTPIIELPEHWSPEYRAVVETRISVIEMNKNIGLIERPEYKRRWVTEGWDTLQARALRHWLLDRCEARDLWFHDVDGLPDQPRLLSTAQLTDLLRPDVDFVSVAELYSPGKELDVVVAELVADEHVPYLAQLRYKDSGLAKRADWEDVWERQRAEDAAESEEEAARIRDAIPVPPKYTSGDFLKNSYWRHRGKLDVPKERFISYPHANRDGDATLLIGWAGWDHREQAQALATVFVDREQNHGWSAERLAPLLAGLREVLPWVRQWHGEDDPMYTGSPADAYEGFLNERRDRLWLTDDDLIAWRPPKVSRGRRKA
ncbi:BREX-2 system adenine-specific DNA-methyltransferase PglX [Sphaerisporangium rubeum]|uniref:site-specific DNA-methyltransferase (adenine-specific) n=1 Tax=Sphaerisporangium rubeum TaxID=321317 RepID=A0A7X0IJ66_9ACTN|nr:hypothetical protein [Sphaerisporangium rubeum]